MLPVRNIRLKTANFVTADGEVMLDELGPEGFSEHRRCCQLIHRLVEAARHAGLLRLGIRVRQGFAGINTLSMSERSSSRQRNFWVVSRAPWTRTSSSVRSVYSLRNFSRKVRGGFVIASQSIARSS